MGLALSRATPVSDNQQMKEGMNMSLTWTSRLRLALVWWFGFSALGTARAEAPAKAAGAECAAVAAFVENGYDYGLFMETVFTTEAILRWRSARIQEAVAESVCEPI